MKKEENKFAPEGWRMLLDKSSDALKRAWKFANEFNLLDKIKNVKVPSALKIGGLALLLSSKSLNAKADDTAGSVKDAKIDNTELSVSRATAAHKGKTATFKSVFRAYPGKYYNEVCNGSPCWLASTYETNGAGIGKNPSSIAMWNDRGNYRGLNQISPAHAQKFLKWLDGQAQFSSVYTELKKGGVGKANWQKTAKDHEHLMTEAFEWYMVEVYNADNFKFIQDQINKARLKVSVRKLHPVILSAMHQIMVERPAARTAIANKIIRFTENHNGDEQKLNSEEFLKTLISNKSVQNRAIDLFRDTSIQWKTAQTKRKLAQGVKKAKDASRQNLLNLAQPAPMGPLPTQITTELKLARAQVSAKSAPSRKAVKPLPARKDVIDNRLLKSKKDKERA